MKYYDLDRELGELKRGENLIEKYGDHFVSYNTKFLGTSTEDNFCINGCNTKDAKLLNEFCFGYDDKYKQIHLLHVYETKNGTKFASIELLMGLYAYWLLSLD